MYSTFEEEGKPNEEDAKTRFLFKQVKHSDLQKSIEALKSQIETNSLGTVSYTTSSNNLSTSIFDLPEHVFRKRSVSDVSTGGGVQDGYYKYDGTVNTGHIPNCRYLPNEDKNKVIDERNKQGVKLGDGRGSNTGNELYKINELKKKNTMFKRSIKALNKKVTNENNC